MLISQQVPVLYSTSNPAQSILLPNSLLLGSTHRVFHISEWFFYSEKKSRTHFRWSKSCPKRWHFRLPKVEMINIWMVFTFFQSQHIMKLLKSRDSNYKEKPIHFRFETRSFGHFASAGGIVMQNERDSQLSISHNVNIHGIMTVWIHMNLVAT